MNTRFRHPAARHAARLLRALREGNDDEAREAHAEVAVLVTRPGTGFALGTVAYAVGEGGPWSDEELAAVGRCTVAEARACRRAVERA